MSREEEMKDLSNQISDGDLGKIKDIASSLMNSTLVCTDEDENPVEIEPLWIEAYLYNKGSYAPDEESGEELKAACHCNLKQQYNFGGLYFHIADKKGRTISIRTRRGVDICLSSEPNFYFSFLIKRACVKCAGKWEYYKEMALEDALSKEEKHRKVEFKDNDKNVELGQCERIHLNPETVCGKEITQEWAFYNVEYCEPSNPRDKDKKDPKVLFKRYIRDIKTERTDDGNGQDN